MIDEVSMVSPKMLAEVEKRLRIAKEAPHSQFGGMCVVLCGDFAQLPPQSEKVGRSSLNAT